MASGVTQNVKDDGEPFSLDGAPWIRVVPLRTPTLPPATRTNCYIVGEAGRADEVRPCISCNQLCWGRRARDYWISCLVNPSAGREFEWGGDSFMPAEHPRQVRCR